MAIVCASCDEGEHPPPPSDSKLPQAASAAPEPRRLYVESDEDQPVDLSRRWSPADGVNFGGPSSATPPPTIVRGDCSPEMVSVAGAFCIDRFEVNLVDAALGRPLSPHYPPSPTRLRQLFERWSQRAGTSGGRLDQSLDLPTPPAYSLSESFEPRARSEQGVVPAGYLNRQLSELACTRAGKRLCTREEWVRACRGQQGTRFPYGERYRPGLCNVHRDHHPARLLHGNSSHHHLDPRLGLVEDEAGPLLHQTGDFPECASRWGDDAIYDMVGNLDEWIADPSGAFLGGFFARSTKEGCDASIDSHAPGYLDYSLGTRCCADPG